MRSLIVGLFLVWHSILSNASAATLDQSGQVAALTAQEAANRLRVHTDGLRSEGRSVDYAKPPAEALFQMVFDLKTFAALPEVTARDLPWLMDWGQVASHSYKAMYLSNVAVGKEPDAATVARSLQQDQDQLAVAIAFLVRLLARELDASKLFMAELPPSQRTAVRLAGMQGLRTEAGQFLYSALCAVEVIKADNAMFVLNAIQETKATWSNNLPSKVEDGVALILKQIAQRRQHENKIGEIVSDLSALFVSNTGRTH